MYKRAFTIRKTRDNPPTEERGMRIFFFVRGGEGTPREPSPSKRRGSLHYLGAASGERRRPLQETRSDTPRLSRVASSEGSLCAPRGAVARVNKWWKEASGRLYVHPFGPRRVVGGVALLVLSCGSNTTP